MGPIVDNYYKGYLGENPTKRIYDVMVIEDKAHKIHNVIVHRFTMGDVEDPELYAAEPLLKWQNSEQGQWVMSHAMETPMWHKHIDQFSYGHAFAITAKLKAKDYSFFLLKWGEEGTLK